MGTSGLRTTLGDRVEDLASGIGSARRRALRERQNASILGSLT